MNIIAIDIGNTNIKLAFYLDDEEKSLLSLNGNAPDIQEQLAKNLSQCWEQIPLVKSAMDPVREGVIVVSSVKPVWTQLVEQDAKRLIGELEKNDS